MKVVGWASNRADLWSAGSHPAQSGRSKSKPPQHRLTEVGCDYTSCVRAPICFYLVLYFKLLLLITVSQGLGLLKLSKSDNRFLYREDVIHFFAFSSLLPFSSMLIPLHPSLQFYTSSTTNNLCLYISIFKGTHLCPVVYLRLQYDLISL